MPCIDIKVAGHLLEAFQVDQAGGPDGPGGSSLGPFLLQPGIHLLIAQLDDLCPLGICNTDSVLINPDLK